MPRVKPLGIVKHMDEWEKRKRREAAEKEKQERIDKVEKEKREKLARKTAVNKDRVKYNRSKASLRRSKGKRRLAGSGVSLKRLLTGR